MSGLINKVKEKIAEVKAEHSSSSSNTTAGPHSSNMANKADPYVDSNLDGRSGMGHSTTTGSGIMGTSGIGSSGANTTAGPHSSDMMNKLDPRVDSDLSGGHMGSSTGTTSGYGTSGTSGMSSGYGTTGSSGYTTGSTNAGPHDSNIANVMDPRVDSDLDGGRNMGMNQTTGSHGNTGSSMGYGGSTNAGPHDSNMANRLDPRVDSDLDGGRNMGMNQTTGSSGYGSTGTTGGTFGSSTSDGYNNEPVHNSSVLNKLDPRVTTSNTTTGTSGMTDSNYGTTGTSGMTGSSYDNTGSSTGPVHNSNLLNKLDPRVDSDTTGTYNSASGSSRLNEPLDAAKHGPSVFKEIQGDPAIHHDFPEQASAGRHGSIGRSDQHYGSGAH